MKNPVDEAKNQRSNNIGPNARDRDRKRRGEESPVHVKLRIRDKTV